MNTLQIMDDDNKARQLYRKAMQQLHPDKNRQSGIKKKYIAERLFFILSKVWDEYSNK